jgi:hypothetical protein
VHVDVGTQNLGGMLHNAQRGRAAVLISAGTYAVYDRRAPARHTRHLHPLAPGTVRPAQVSSVTSSSGTTSFDGRSRWAKSLLARCRSRQAIRRDRST